MTRSPARGAAALRLALLGALALRAFPQAADEGAYSREAIRGTLSSTLLPDAMSLRLGLGGGPSSLALGFDSCEDGYYLEGGLYLESLRSERIILAAGPGSVSGSLRLLADPTSLAALSPGPPVALDPSLSSRSSILGLQAGFLSLFGIAQGRGPIAFASNSDALGGGGRSMDATAGGCSLSWATKEIRVEALASASFPGAGSPSSGWRPDPYPSQDPLSGGGPSPQAGAALIVARRDEGGSLLAAVSGSYGRLAGPALAFRLETREIAGSLDVRLGAAFADPSFIALFGEGEERLASGLAEARLAFRRSGSLTVSVKAEAAGQGRRYAPLWGEAGTLKLVLPIGSRSLRILEPRLELRRSPFGIGGGDLGLAIKAGRADEGGAASVSASLAWEKALSGVVIKVATDLADESGLPRLGLDLGLELLRGGRAASPVLAKGGIGLALPWGRSGSLELDLGLPGNGVALEPVLASRSGLASSAAGFPVFRLRYAASFDASARRPRSGRPAGRKALLLRDSALAPRRGPGRYS